jgi:hypothetical protein
MPCAIRQGRCRRGMKKGEQHAAAPPLYKSTI